MRDRSAAILIENSNILLFKREKKEDKYFALPGGTIEENETPNEAIIRELKEELDVDISIKKNLFEIENQGRMEYYFLVERFSGEFELVGPEMVLERKDDRYEILWIKLNDFEKVNNFYPKNAQKKIVDLIKQMLISKND